MQFIKCKSDELAMLEKLMDHEDIIDRILDGLDDDYKPIVDVINGRDTPNAFEELHEKLISRELVLRRSPATSTTFPITASVAQVRSPYTHSNRNKQEKILSTALEPVSAELTFYTKKTIAHHRDLILENAKVVVKLAISFNAASNLL